jgi:uncharacterized protein (TIGR03435 family)
MAAMASLVVLTAGDIKIGAQPRLDSQRQSSTPTFRRVSITVNESGGERGFCCRLEPGGRVIATNATLRQLIQAAYVRHGFDRREVEGGPAWVESTRFDLVADGEAEHAFDRDGVPRQTWAMLQAVLADRFKVRLRTESRPGEAYLLVLARTDHIGPRLRRSDVDCAAVMEMELKGQRPEKPVCAVASYPGRLVATALTLPTLGTLLSRIVDRPVIDQTGLDGLFDLELEAVEIKPTGPVGPSLRPSDTTQSIFEALPAHLGLKLQATQGTIDILVIESAERPTPG